jgi:superfamily I DNA/RNA helicase
MDAAKVRTGGKYRIKVGDKIVVCVVDRQWDTETPSGDQRRLIVVEVATKRKHKLYGTEAIIDEVPSSANNFAPKRPVNVAPPPRKAGYFPEGDNRPDFTPVATAVKKSATAMTSSSASPTVAPVTKPQKLGIMALAKPQTEPTPVATVGGRTPTAEQGLIIEAARQLRGQLVVEAGAGCGKTSSLAMVAATKKGRGQYTALNSSLVKESAAKFGGNIACNTTHSLAFRQVGKRYAHRLEGRRVRSSEIARILGVRDMPLGEKVLPADYLASCVMQAVKRFRQSADPAITAKHFKYIDGIDTPTDGKRTYSNNEAVRAYLEPFAAKAWADISSEHGVLPFSHDDYVKVWQLDKPRIYADYILLDEAQDTAEVFLDILRQQKAPLILVGDSAQQIYEWRGAVNAMASFSDAPRKYLSQSFRFGPAIADVANRVLDTLENPTQLRLRGLESIPSRIERLDDPTAVLCRTNASAVGTLLNALVEENRPHLIGGGADVIAFVEAAQQLQRGQATSHPDLACFSSWCEVQQYVREDEGEDLKLMVKIIDGFGTEAILQALRSMVPESQADLVISTAHKAKGREWDRVQLASDFPARDRCDDADRKLLYVAVTRAKLVLDVTRCPWFGGGREEEFYAD